MSKTLEAEVEELLRRVAKVNLQHCRVMDRSDLFDDFPALQSVHGSAILDAFYGELDALKKRPKFYDPEYAFDEQYRRLYDATYAREQEHHKYCKTCRAER